MSSRIFTLLLVSTIVVLASCGGGGSKPPPGPTAAELAQLGAAALLLGTGDTAKQHFSDAVAIDANQRQANFGLGLLDLFDVANDVVGLLATTNIAPFRNISSIGLGPLPVPQLGGQPLAPTFRGGSVTDSDFPDVDIQSMTGAELRQLLLTALGGLDSAIAHMQTALAGSDATFTFQCPKDWNTPTAGVITLSRADMYVLVGGLQLAAAQLHLAAAYDESQLNLVNTAGDLTWTGIGATSDPQDTNTDGFIDLSELATAQGIPAALGLRLADGHARLTKYADYMQGAADALILAGDIYSTGTELDAHWGFELGPGDVAQFKTEWPLKHRIALQVFSEAFSPTGTLLTKVRLDTFDDSGSSVPADFSLRVNLRSFITGWPADLRQVPVRWQDDGFGDLNLPAAVGDAFTDPTVLGLFPDGLSQANYDVVFGDG